MASAAHFRGGEDAETSLEAAKRELYEETALVGVNWLQLDSCVHCRKQYLMIICIGPSTYMLFQSMPSQWKSKDPLLSSEHSEYRWSAAIQAQKLLKYDSNRIAQWELCERLKHQGKRIPELDRF